MSPATAEALSQKIHTWAKSLGFQGVGITDTDLGIHEEYLNRWLEKNFHGEMAYMGAHGNKRSRPSELVENSSRVISLRMNYLPENTQPLEVLASDEKAYIARYTMGRDYHKVIRKRLVKLWKLISEHLSEQGLDHYQGRVFTDSAPVLEKAIAEKAGLGWIGKNTLLLNRDAGSWFFIGEILTDIPLTIDAPYTENHCGSCTSCIDICPTQAIIAPYQLDARKCISYLTIEHKGVIDVSLREAMGNRIFGCDDCQLYCPWNKFAKITDEADFSPRHHLDATGLLDLFAWREDEYLSKTEGSAIRRAGFESWQRNIAIALGNADYSEQILAALIQKRNVQTENTQKEGAQNQSPVSAVVKIHIDWAIQMQSKQRDQGK